MMSDRPQDNPADPTPSTPGQAPSARPADAKTRTAQIAVDYIRGYESRCRGEPRDEKRSASWLEGWRDADAVERSAGR